MVELRIKIPRSKLEEYIRTGVDYIDISMDDLITVDKNSAEEVLDSLGIGRHLDGFKYLVKAFEILKNSNKDLHCMELYEKIAESYEITAAAVERCIRHAISLCNEKSCIYKNLLRRYKSVTNSVFIYNVLPLIQ